MPPGENHYTVNVPVASLYRRPSKQSPKETELLFGTQFQISTINRGWAKGREISPVVNSAYEGYKGYIPVKSLIPSGTEPTHIVTALTAPVFKGPDIKSQVNTLWPMTARFAGEEDGDFVKSSFGFVHQRHVRWVLTPPGDTDFVTVAEQYIGLPYIWAGVSSLGLDCSGLVQTALRAVGRDAFRDSCDQRGMGSEITETQPLRRGDLIFWKGHVGIMQDGHNLLHANAHHMKVASEPLQDAMERIKKNYGPVIARRRL